MEVSEKGGKSLIRDVASNDTGDKGGRLGQIRQTMMQ